MWRFIPGVDKPPEPQPKPKAEPKAETRGRPKKVRPAEDEGVPVIPKKERKTAKERELEARLQSLEAKLDLSLQRGEASLSQTADALEAEAVQSIDETVEQSLELHQATLEASMQRELDAREVEALRQQLREREEQLERVEAARLETPGSSSACENVASAAKDVALAAKELLKLASVPLGGLKGGHRSGERSVELNRSECAQMGRLLGELGAEAGEAGAEAGRKLGVLGTEKGGLSVAKAAANAACAAAGAKWGHLGGEAGKAAGAKYGHLGGRPLKRKAAELDEEGPQGKLPSKQLKASLDPQKTEDTAATALQFRNWCLEKLKEAGKGEEDMTTEFMQGLQQAHFTGKLKTRRMMQLWNDKAGKSKRVKELELGTQGAKRKKGEHSVMRQHMGLGIRAVKEATKLKKSQIHKAFSHVREKFYKWRSSGQYVDREDLCDELEQKLKTTVSLLQDQKSKQGPLDKQESKLLVAAEKRLDSHVKDPRNRQRTMDQMQRLFGCRLLRPQRLIHIGLEEERKRVWDSWHFWDWALWLACHATEEELGEHVSNPDLFRKNIKRLVLSHSDQMPFWVKLQPGKQLYLRDEVEHRKKLDAAEAQSKIGESQKVQGVLDTDGMTQLRGECHGNQDKFRITVDLEQIVLGFCDEPEVSPRADFGLTSVIFTGKHFREHNVDENRCYIEDEKYFRDGIEVCHLAGTRVEAGLGNQILDFREDHPEMFKEMKELGFRFYQQPAGFEDSLISCWKIQEQQKVHGINLSLRDLFTGALSKWAREQSFICQQICSWIRGKVTALIQTADAIVIRPVKLKTGHKHVQMRRELIQLAELQDTRAVFKCGTYEIMRCLLEVIRECRHDFRQNNRLLEGIYSLGWLSLRPNMKTNKLEKTEGQAWCKDFKLGSHRIQKSWLEGRFSHLDENGKPCPDFQELDENGMPEDCEQTYMVKPGEQRSLAAWKEMRDSGQITEQEMSEWKDEPWFEMAVSSFKGIQGLEEYADLMKTPREQRIERGIDPCLTSQRRDQERAKRLKRKRELRKLAREPLRKEAAAQMRALREQGFSVAQISAAMICPELGAKKGKKAKKGVRDAIAKKLAASKKVKDQEPKAEQQATLNLHGCAQDSNCKPQVGELVIKVQD